MVLPSPLLQSHCEKHLRQIDFLSICSLVEKYFPALLDISWTGDTRFIYRSPIMYVFLGWAYVLKVLEDICCLSRTPGMEILAWQVWVTLLTERLMAYRTPSTSHRVVYCLSWIILGRVLGAMAIIHELLWRIFRIRSSGNSEKFLLYVFFYILAILVTPLNIT